MSNTDDTIEAVGWLMVTEDGFYDITGFGFPDGSGCDDETAKSIQADTIAQAREREKRMPGIVSQVYKLRLRVPRPCRVEIDVELDSDAFRNAMRFVSAESFVSISEPEQLNSLESAKPAESNPAESAKPSEPVEPSSEEWPPTAEIVVEADEAPPAADAPSVPVPKPPPTPVARRAELETAAVDRDWSQRLRDYLERCDGWAAASQCALEMVQSTRDLLAQAEACDWLRVEPIGRGFRITLVESEDDECRTPR